MTLFININGENTQSTENITVVGKPEDAIINKFYFELAKGIVKGVAVLGIGEVKKKSLVTDFESINIEAFAKITEQWEIVKQILLGENPSGTQTVTFPNEYIDWLKYHSNPIYNEIAKSLASRGNAVEISIERIYGNAITMLVNNIDLSKQYDQFVVNDDLVKENSRVSADVRKMIGEDVLFVAYDDWKHPKDEGGNAVSTGENDSKVEDVKEGRLIIAEKTNNNGGVVGVDVFDSYNNLIYNRKATYDFSRLDIRWARPSDNLPPKLYVGDGYSYTEMDVIGLDGQIEKVAQDDLPWMKRSAYELFDKDAFLKKHPEYFDCDVPRHQIGIKDFIIEGLKGKPRTDYRVDVWTSSGQLLCTLPSMTYIAEVLPSGLYVISKKIDEDYFAYGIADKYGKILLPCKYGKHHRNQVGDQPFREEEPGIVYCFEFCTEESVYDESRRYKDVFNGDFYFQVTKDFLVKRKQVETKGFYHLVYTIIDRENGKTLYSFKSELTEELEDLKDGWYEFPVAFEDEESTLLISKQSSIMLPGGWNDSKVYDCYSAKGYNRDGYDTTDGKIYFNHPFISEDRVIISEENPDGVELQSFKNILIYSYSGRQVKKYDFQKLPILIKSPYKYGKAPALKIKGNSISLCYLDLDGNEHQIPNKSEKIRGYAKTEMFMASENTFVINSEEEDEDGFNVRLYELRNLEGDTLFRSEYKIIPLADGLLEYSCEGYGVVDANGNILIHPNREYHFFEAVVYSDGKYKKYRAYGDGEEL